MKRKNAKYVVYYKLDSDFLENLERMIVFTGSRPEYDTLVGVCICDQLGLDFSRLGLTWDYECDLNTGVAVIRGK